MTRTQKLIEAAYADRQVRAEQLAAKLGDAVRVEFRSGEAVDGAFKVRVVARTNRANHNNLTAGQLVFYVNEKRVTKDAFAIAAA